MKQRLLMSVLLTAAFVTAAIPACAGEGVVTNAATTGRVAIEQLTREALEKNPELRFYEAELQAAKAGRKAAGVLQNPELSGGVGAKNSRDRSTGATAEGVAWSVSVMQPFEWPGRIGLRKAIANRDIELAELGYARFKVALAAQTRVLAYELFAAQERMKAAGEVAERFKALREVLVQREPAGLTPLLETRVIEATELTAQHKANDAERAVQTALLELNQLRGAEPRAPLAVEKPEFTFRAAGEMNALVAMARSNNFELRTRAVELAQQGFRVSLAKNERYPSLSVGPTYSEENAFDRERIIGVGISLPLPLWNRNTANIETADARRVQAETSFLIAQREMERKVAGAVLTYESRLREMSQWNADAVQHFRDAADLADRHYRLGAVPVSVYVELQKQYLEAVETLLDTRKEALEAASNLELLTGLTPPLAAAKEEKQ